jgi:predicted membrane-bound spermidine synthase
MAIGSLCIAKLSSKCKNKAALFIIFQVIIAVYAVFVLTNFNLVVIISKFLSGPRIISSLFIKSTIEFFSGIIFLILPTFLCGACFPLAVSMATKYAEDVGEKVGSFYSWDMFGAVVGTITSGFLLIPLLGLKITLVFAASLNFFASILIIPKIKQKIILLFFSIVIILIFLMLNWGPNKYLDIGPIKHFRLEETDTILFRKQSSYGVVNVIKSKDLKFLAVNSNIMCYCEKGVPAVRSEQRISEVVLQILDKNKTQSPVRILNVGLGCGFTLDYLRKSDRVTSIDVVEINPVMSQATKLFSKENNNVLDDPRINITIEDGFEFLKNKNKKKYDAIVVDIESPLIFHSSSLYTMEFFEEASENLKENGIFALWGYPAQDEKRSKILFDTQQTVFNFVYPLTFELDQLFFSSNQEITLMDKIMDQDSKDLYSRFLQSKKTEINSLNNPILKTYFNSY